MSEQPSRRNLLRSAAAIPALAVPGLVAAKAMPERPTPMLLHAYNEWLDAERRLLNVELFPHNWKKMEHCIFFTGIGGYHWNDYPKGPKPSTRAAIVLDAVGANWRELRDCDHLRDLYL